MEYLPLYKKTLLFLSNPDGVCRMHFTAISPLPPAAIDKISKEPQHINSLGAFVLTHSKLSSAALSMGSIIS